MAEHKEDRAHGSSRVYRRDQEQDVPVSCPVADHHAVVDGSATNASLCTASGHLTACALTVGNR